MKRSPTFLITVLCFGFAFFYIPILSMIVFSFNNSRLATVWGGFSTKWYVSLLSNDAVINALILSLKIALVSATIATILGTMAGITLARFTKFRGRTLFSGLVTAPLIMPEVITGISMLIFFILIASLIEWLTGWKTQRGFTTMTLAHITFSMVFVTTIINARMVQSDRAIEEAAMDLGSRPWQVMFDVTLPVIFPAILSGWLLAFTISLDDVVISAFTTGPGSTTLPLLIWSKVKLGVTPDINALATLMVLTVGIGVFAAGMILNRAEKRRLAEERMAFRSND